MDLKTALGWAAQRKNAVLITIRKDGRPQSSDVSYFVDDDGSTDASGGRIIISVTDSRAKTRNLRRDGRAVVHVTDPAAWSYVSFDGTVELSPVAAGPDDATADGLVDYYRRVAGQDHPDWDEYRRAMVDEGRLLITFTPMSVVGHLPGS